MTDFALATELQPKPLTHDIYADLLLVNYESWCLDNFTIKSDRHNNGFLVYNVDIDLNIVEHPQGFWDNIETMYLNSKTHKKLLDKKYIVNIVKDSNDYDIIINVIFSEFMISEFFNTYHGWPSIIQSIKLWNFEKNGKLHLDPFIVTKNGLTLKFPESEIPYISSQLKSSLQHVKDCNSETIIIYKI